MRPGRSQAAVNGVEYVASGVLAEKKAAQNWLAGGQLPRLTSTAKLQDRDGGQNNGCFWDKMI